MGSDPCSQQAAVHQGRGDPPLVCDLCDAPLSVYHILVECRKYAPIRLAPYFNGSKAVTVCLLAVMLVQSTGAVSRKIKRPWYIRCHTNTDCAPRNCCSIPITYVSRVDEARSSLHHSRPHDMFFIGASAYRRVNDVPCHLHNLIAWRNCRES
uniref:Uncharacterized protein n=1 Tax=Timema bartmani TaxID=61472 RepID=A0A7R9I812_9NEOP|nr:unnamed protein product [Timema bartmani]